MSVALTGFTAKCTYRVDVVEQLAGGRFEHSIHHITHQLLQSVQQIIKGYEGTLRFNVRVPKGKNEPSGNGSLAGWFYLLSTCLSDRFYSLRQVSAGAGLFCSVGLSDAEGVTQGRYAGLQVELGRLCQVGLLSKVVQVKERGTTFHLSLHQCRRSDLPTETTQTGRGCRRLMIKSAE